MYDEIAYLVVDPSIFNSTDMAWTKQAEDWPVLRSLISDGKYQDQALWKNLTANKCRNVYEASYITKGYAFGVPAPSWRKENHQYFNSAGKIRC